MQPGAQAPANAPGPEPVVKGSWKADQRWTLGSPTAPVTLVEFTDYQCPFCRQFHTNTFEEIRKKYVDTGKVRFISTDFPLEIHGNAPKAAEAAHCPPTKINSVKCATCYPPMQPSSRTTICSAIRGLYLNVDAFRDCLDSGKYAGPVADSQKAAAALGISATPSFLIGKSRPDGVDGVILVGASPLAVFEARTKELGGSEYRSAAYEKRRFVRSVMEGDLPPSPIRVG